MTCSLCTTPDVPLAPHPVPGGPADASADICATCATSLDAPTGDHFRALASSMWSEDVAVQVLAARTLAKLDTPWARDLLDQLYLDEDTQAWVDNVVATTNHKDATVPRWPLAIRWS